MQLQICKGDEVILDIDRDATPEELQKAYAAQLREIEASRDCNSEKLGRENKACKMKKKHLKKAWNMRFEAILMPFGLLRTF